MTDGDRTGATRASTDGRLKRWLLLTGNRLAVTGVLVVLVFGTLLSVSILRPLDMHQLLAGTDAAQNMFQALLRGAILLVTIVVSINSIVLSQEMVDIESQKARIDAAMEYRTEIESLTERDASPARPAEYLVTIFSAIDRQSQRLTDLAENSGNEAYRRRVEGLAEDVSANLRRVGRSLEDQDVGTFRALLTGLQYEYAEQLYAARRLLTEFGAERPEQDREVMNDLVDLLMYFAVGREHFKSLYYERELARLSERLLYLSLPVIVFTSYVILAVDAGQFPDTSAFGVSPAVVFVVFAFTVAVTPYLVLTAYIVRLVTITLLTLAVGPFVLEEQASADALDEGRVETERGWRIPQSDEE